MTNPDWDPRQYLRFGDHRLRPALDLLARVDVADPMEIHDVGCGTGAVTRLLATRWPGARIVGSDTSREMLEAAAATPGTPASIEWRLLDVRDWDPQRPLDLITANAVLHWVPGHDDVIRRMLDSLRPGGVLAIQMPLSWPEPSHRLMLATLESLELGSEAVRQVYRRMPVAAPEHYVRLLTGATDRLDVWVTRYLQLLPGPDPVLEWVRGTGLRPILEDLTPEEVEVFFPAYAAALQAAYPQGADGITVFPFPRLFIVAGR